ncbi:hypothetical protein G6023_07285 [Dietzia sp. DQ11-71]|nr:hypothetical protein [Dietzia sp. DQ11-71]
MVDQHRNFKHDFRPRLSGQPIIQLERGINISREIRSLDGPRRPGVALRSSPWKSGTETTPWHDEYDLDSGKVRFFGDNRATTSSGRGGGSGTRGLISLAPLFYSASREYRKLAPPIALFRGESVPVPGRGLVHTGFVRLIGLALLESHGAIQQTDIKGVDFENYVFTLRLCPLHDTDGRIDWGWINDRRDETVPAAVANLRAPYAWRHWIETGRLPS